MANTYLKMLGLIVTLGFVTRQAWALPDETDTKSVTDCRFLGSVAGNSGFGKNLGWKPLAKASAEAKAAQLGGTHIVFTNFRAIGSFNGEATGKVYICRP